jgi:hypothetical protein
MKVENPIWRFITKATLDLGIPRHPIMLRQYRETTGSHDAKCNGDFAQ